MSTITVKNGIMAADGMNISMGYIDKKQVERIFRLEVKKYGEPDSEGYSEYESSNIVYVGVVGNLHDCNSFIAWYINSSSINEFKAYFDHDQINVSAIIYDSLRNEYTKYHNSPLFYPCSSETAIGSGASFALGAMKMGAEAVEAVLATSDLDPFTNKNVHYIRLCDNSTELSYVN